MTTNWHFASESSLIGEPGTTPGNGRASKKPKPSPNRGRLPDRRESCRYHSLVTRAWVGWYDDSGTFRRVPAFIKDISQGGCLLFAHRPEPPVSRLFLRLDGELLPHWFETQLLEQQIESETTVRCRLIFPGGCPYPLFTAVAFGCVAHSSLRRELGGS